MKKNIVKKPRIAIIGLTSCEGCQFVLLDLGPRFLNWLKLVELDDFRLLSEAKTRNDRYDICFVEGNPITKENIALLKDLRERSKYLVVLGNCAALGGVWELKNYQLKQKTIKQVYKTKMKVANPDIKEVDNFVKVDFTIPGCPINSEEFLTLADRLLKGRLPRVDQSPVCRECQSRGYECLLQKGQICLGPITLSGCEAVCLKSKQPCWGCRGLFEGAKIENLLKCLRTEHGEEKITRIMEVFGARDSIFKQLSIDEKPKPKSKKK